MTDDTVPDAQSPPSPGWTDGTLGEGTVLGHYTIQGLIGRGGMGEVYKAYDPHLGRHVAIKILAATLATHPELQQRFEREALAASALTHKNICTIFDVGQHAGRPFFVMELLEGDTLEATLNAGPLPVAQLLDIGIQVADALEFAHARGILHRDVKSANIFLTRRGDAKVLDFGIAKSLKDAEAAGEVSGVSLTQPGAVVGTLSHMSPEQLTGEKVDFRSDLFSFGVVLFQMATGSLPYGGSAAAILAGLCAPDPVPSVTSLNPGLPVPLERVVATALAKDAAQRFQTAGDLLAELRDLRRSIVLSQSGGTITPRALAARRSWWRRDPALTAAVAVATTAALAVGASYIGHVLARPGIRTLAVLPCQGVGQVNVDYQCSVIGENLRSNLSQIPGVVVMSDQAVQARATPSRSGLELGRQLGVDAVVTTAVRPGRDSIAVTVEVTPVRSGTYLYEHTFSGPLVEIQDLQREIARSVVDSLRPKLSTADRRRLEVFQMYQAAEYEWNRRTADGLERAIALFDQVLKRDSTFAPAWSGLASSYSLLPYYSDASAEAYAKAKTAAEIALRLDESLADAHAALGLVKRDYDRDWAGAEQEFRRAIELNPESGTSHQWYAELLNTSGRFEEAERQIREAVRVMPLSLTARAVHGLILLCAGRPRESEAELLATLDMHAEFPVAHWFLGQLYAVQGRYAEAERALLEAVRLSPNAPRMLADLGSVYALRGYRAKALAVMAQLRQSARGTKVPRLEYAVIYAGLGNRDAAIRELNAALGDRTWQVISIKVDPMLRPLHADPRFGALVRRTGLPSD